MLRPYPGERPAARQGAGHPRRAQALLSLYRTTVGRKVAMAVTGAIYLGISLESIARMNRDLVVASFRGE